MKLEEGAVNGNPVTKKTTMMMLGIGVEVLKAACRGNPEKVATTAVNGFMEAMAGDVKAKLTPVELSKFETSLMLVVAMACKAAYELSEEAHESKRAHGTA